ncbi:IclR family transcriptional regulator [Sneathiella chinensis]|uniref:Transcriptional regulator n=1 Tax=Sneathiella chinensis TaxID=349750 RepID=A0ABQ5U1D2_9PROT|nr:IclR family transcriptional regulator [Sneathiella chinensis]GLQ05157.1 transcriptional regulator [Sneathiella chinensis]
MRPRNQQKDPNAKDRDFVTALARGLQLLRCFKREDKGLGNKDFAQRTGLSNSTVSRLTYTLWKLGYMEFDPDTARYRLAPPVLALGYSCLHGLSAIEMAKPMMQEIATHCGMPVAAGGQDGLTIIYIDRCTGSNPVTLSIPIGAHVDLITSGIGRGFLAGRTAEERTTLLESIKEQDAENWDMLYQNFEKSFECYQEHGYCLSIGEWKPDINSIGVPFTPKDGTPPLAFNCAGPASHLTEEQLRTDIGPRLVEMVEKLHAIYR